MVEDFWTPERMRNAIPVDVYMQDDDIRMKELHRWGDAAKSSSDPEIVVAEPALPQPGISPAKPNGKFFAYDPINNIMRRCSGAAINGNNKRLIATAAHCIHSGPNGYIYPNWKFVPNYYYSSGEQSGVAPDGIFRGTTGWMTSDWPTYGESGKGFNSDWFFVVTRADFSSQMKVVDTVGGHGMKIGGSYNFSAVLFGYPKNIADGLVIQRCDASTYLRSIGIYDFVSVNGCNFGEGASGDPWLGSYNNTTGLGYLRSVSSWGPRYNNSHISGPYLSYEAWELYYYAHNDDGWNGGD